MVDPGPVPPPPKLWRLRGRHSFAALRTAGRRSRRGPVSVTWLPGTTDSPPQVGYAIGRRVGGSVVRNRLRRRLRASATQLAPAFRPGGSYLISAGPGAVSLPSEALCRHLRDALAAVHTLP